MARIINENNENVLFVEEKTVYQDRKLFVSWRKRDKNSFSEGIFSSSFMYRDEKVVFNVQYSVSKITWMSEHAT